MSCNIQYRLYVGPITSVSGNQFYVDICLWCHYIRSFFVQLSFAYCWFFLRTQLYISIHCDALLFLIIAAYFVVSRCCLRCLCFLMDWYIFTVYFILFAFLIRLRYLFYHRVINCIRRFRLFFIGICLSCRLAFDWYVWCSRYCPFQLSDCFPFWLLLFWVLFSVLLGLA